MLNHTSWFARWCNLHSLAIIINLINLSVYGAVGTASVLSAIQHVPNTLAINIIAWGTSVLLLISELHLSRLTEEYFKFLITFRGRGLLYILLGFIAYQGGMAVNMIVSYYTIVVGLTFEILSFLPLMPLNDIRNNWKAHRHYCEELHASFCSSPYNSSGYNRQMANTLRGAPAVGESSGFGSHYSHQIPRPPPKTSNRAPLTNQSRPASRLQKDHGQLAMEINEALIQVQYSDFASSGKASDLIYKPEPTDSFEKLNPYRQPSVAYSTAPSLEKQMSYISHLSRPNSIIHSQTVSPPSSTFHIKPHRVTTLASPSRYSTNSLRPNSRPSHFNTSSEALNRSYQNQLYHNEAGI